MSLFTGSMRQHIKGYKEVTEHVDIVEVKAGKEVFIPLVCGPSIQVEVLVKEGDTVGVGTKIAVGNDRTTVPIYASVSGTIKGVKKMMHASLKQVNHLIIENDGEYRKEKSFDALDYKSADRETLTDFMMNAGIIGLGGAGFPTYVKYKNVQSMDKLIINAVECEPYITADYKMLLQYHEEFLTGVLAMQKMAVVKEVDIAIKGSHPDLIQFIEKLIQGFEGIRVVRVPDVYPMGWERTLVRELLRKEYNKLPMEVGVVVNNATTAIAFGQALLHGTPIIHKVLTVSGNAILHPANVRVPIGVPAHEVVAACGGYTCEHVKLIAGGPMMGNTIVNDAFVIDRNMNALTILANQVYESISCLRCGKCSDNCPAGLQPVLIAQALKIKDTQSMQKLCSMDCIECGLCSYVCPSRLDVTENARRAKRQLALAKK